MDSIELQPSEAVINLQTAAKSPILPDLEEFVKLSHNREFQKAHDLFREKLEAYVDKALFVTIEFADLLLEQGNYGTLQLFLADRIEIWTKIEEDVADDPVPKEAAQLFRLMQSLVTIFRKGALRQALVQACRCKNFLSRNPKLEWKDFAHFPSSIQIYTFEIYLQIIVFALQTSNWATLSNLDPPWYNSSSVHENGILLWFRSLQDRGFHWEASRVLRILRPILPMLPSNDVITLVFEEQAGEGEQVKGTTMKSSQVEESNLVADSAVDFVKAQSILDTTVGEYKTVSSAQLGREILYARGKHYLNKTQTQASSDTTRLGASDIEVELEKRDYAAFGEAFHLNTSSISVRDIKISDADYRIRMLDQIRTILTQPENNRTGTWDKYIKGILAIQKESGDCLGFIRAWELFATNQQTKLRAHDSDIQVASLLSSKRDALQLLMMTKFRLFRVKDIPDAHILMMKSLEQITSNTFTDGYNSGLSYKSFSYEKGHEDSSYDSEKIDIPLYIWAYLQKKEQLWKNGLLLDKSRTDSDYTATKVTMEVVRNCLPEFNTDLDRTMRQEDDD